MADLLQPNSSGEVLYLTSGASANGNHWSGRGVIAVNTKRLELGLGLRKSVEEIIVTLKLREREHPGTISA